MYSRELLASYIKQKGLTQSQLASQLKVSASNLNRALFSEKHHLTLPQFAKLVEALALTPDQVYHILTGKKEKEAVNQLVSEAINEIMEEFIHKKTVNNSVNKNAKKGGKQNQPIG